MQDIGKIFEGNTPVEKYSLISRSEKVNQIHNTHRLFLNISIKENIKYIKGTISKTLKYVIPALNDKDKLKGLSIYCAKLASKKNTIDEKYINGLIVTSSDQEAKNLATAINIEWFNQYPTANYPNPFAKYVKDNNISNHATSQIYTISKTRLKAIYGNQKSWDMLMLDRDFLVVDGKLEIMAQDANGDIRDVFEYKSLVCFDYNVNINKLYESRAAEKNDIYIVRKYSNKRNYNGVTVNIMPKSSSSIKISKAKTILREATKTGEKILIVLTEIDQAVFTQLIDDREFNDKDIVITNWKDVGAVNKWKKYDSYILISSEVDDAKVSDLASDIIDVIHQIRNKKDSKSNIYILIPTLDTSMYKEYIEKQMPKVQIKDWNV